jgi:hypothetical protein
MRHRAEGGLIPINYKPLAYAQIRVHLAGRENTDWRPGMSGVRLVSLATIVVVAFVCVYVVSRHRRNRTKRLIGDLLEGYFDGRITPDLVANRARQIASAGFLGSANFLALAHAAFQHAADAKLTQKGYSHEDERKLLSLSATLVNEFGLPERNRIEGWRAGRE